MYHYNILIIPDNDNDNDSLIAYGKNAPNNDDAISVATIKLNVQIFT